MAMEGNRNWGGGGMMPTLNDAHGVIPGSLISNHSWWSLVDHNGCQ